MLIHLNNNKLSQHTNNSNRLCSPQFLNILHNPVSNRLRHSSSSTQANPAIHQQDRVECPQWRRRMSLHHLININRECHKQP